MLGRDRPTHGQDRERTHEAKHEAHGIDPIREQLRAVLDRARPVVQQRETPVAERHDPLALVAGRLREEAADAPSFAMPTQARAFREEMERQFDPDTLVRLGRGEETTLAQITNNRLDGLCLARAYLDSHGEPLRSEARMSLVYRISDAQIDARRERHGHDEDGHSHGL